jgi:hypothetical protein
VNEHNPIEEALRKLRPAELESPLMARLTAARPQSGAAEKRSPWRELLTRWLMPIAASACAAVATFAFLEHNRGQDARGRSDARTTDNAKSADVDAGKLLPVESEDYLVSARPVGIIVAPDRRPYRIMDVEWLEHETVQVGADGAAFHTATTRRDVIPVALELY